jgi:hypothetical protein
MVSSGLLRRVALVRTILNLFAMEITAATNGYNYNEHYSTRSCLDPTDGTVLH